MVATVTVGDENEILDTEYSNSQRYIGLDMIVSTKKKSDTQYSLLHNDTIRILNTSKLEII